jgi:spore germination protein GerM
MQEQKKGYQFSTGLIAGVSSVLIIAGGFAAWWAWIVIKGEPTPAWITSLTQPNRSNSSENLTSEKVEAQVYWLKVTDNQIELAAKPMLIEQAEENVVVEKALQKLLAGTQEGNYTSTIPEATQLRSVSFQGDGIHIDLSQEFTFGGGSASMIGRVGQVLYTATSLDPEAKVWLEVQGEPLEYLGGEGVYIPQPLTRKEFQANYEL